MRLRSTLRASILVTLGLTPACGGTTAPSEGASRTETGARPDGGGAATSFVGVCSKPEPVVVGGQATGFVRCDEGHVHREEAKRCPAPAADVATCATIEGARCRTNADCTAAPRGFCDPTQGGEGSIACSCRYVCFEDADCGAGKVCECTPRGGQCVDARCRTDAECGSGLCASATANGCGKVFACQSAEDRCAGARDCADESPVPVCDLASGSSARACSGGGCVDGRPFLVEDAVRLAPVRNSADWRAVSLAPDVASLSVDERAARAARWSRVGQMEHASIAAFARFSMQLLALGAPPELVSDSARAMADETRHAELAFGLASTYAGRALGPGPLDIDAALTAVSLADVVRLTFREGCIGETVATLEAGRALEREDDEVVRGVLTQIIADETRHAELAWRFVQWALHQDARAVAEVVRDELARARATYAGDAFVDAVRDVVVPCAAALLASVRDFKDRRDSTVLAANSACVAARTDVAEL